MDLAIIRPAGLKDLNTLIDFSQRAGIGITSLPQNPQVLEAKLRAVEAAYSPTITAPHHESYLFCLEWQNKVVGISGIVSRIGMSEPFFAYHLLHEKIHSPSLKIEREVPLLHFIQARKKPTEIGTLFVLPEFRDKKHGFGKLLSFSRFLFIANFRFRFASIVIAELRGFNENGVSPFWEAVGRPFFGIPFSQADFLRTSFPHTIEEVFPKHPIYCDLLPEPAREAIGKVHKDTLPAIKLVERQGFKNSGYYDIFDAGPHYYCPTDQIHAVQSSEIGIVKELKEDFSEGKKALVANTNLNYRCCEAYVLETDDNKVLLHKEVARALNVGVGDPVRYYAI